MKISREIKTAILVIGSLLLFVWGYSFLKGTDLFEEYKTLYVQYDNVEGLTVSAPVTLNGLVIGKVHSIKLDNKTGKLTVELQIKSDFPITRSSMVNLYEPGLIGGKQIQVVPNFDDQTMAKSGDYMNGRIVPGLTALVGEKLTPLQEKLEKAVVSADTLLTNFNTVLDPKTKQNIKLAIANLNETLNEFKGAGSKLNTILSSNSGKLDRTFTNLDKASTDLSQITDSLQKADLGKTVRKLQSTLAEVDAIIAGMNSGKGTLGKLLKDDALYINLTKTSKELEILLEDVRLNPTRYINVSLFGKKNKPYVAPVVIDTTKGTKK